MRAMKLFAKGLLALFLLNSMVSLIECDGLIDCDFLCSQKNPLSPGYFNLSISPVDGVKCTNYHKLMKCFDKYCEANSTEQHKERYKKWKGCREDPCADTKGLCSGVHSDDWPSYLNKHKISAFGSDFCKSIRENLDCRENKGCPTTFPFYKKAELRKCSKDLCAKGLCPGLHSDDWPSYLEQHNISGWDSDFCKSIRENLDCRENKGCPTTFPPAKEAELDKCINPTDPCDPITGTIHCSGFNNNNWPYFFQQNNISEMDNDFCRSIRENVDCRIKNKCPNSFPKDKDAELKECINKDPCAAANGPCPGFDINWSIFFQYINVWELGQKACTAIRENRDCRKNNSCPVEKTFPDEKMTELEECIKPKTTENPFNTTAANEAMASTNCLLFLFLANAWIALLTMML